MITLLPGIAVAGAIALGAMVPGPGFILVVQAVVARGRRDLRRLTIDATRV